MRPFSLRIAVARACALWIVLLVILPATAPFSTCDLSDLLGLGVPRPAPVTVTAVPAAKPDSATSLPATRPVSRRVRLAALPSVPFAEVLGTRRPNGIVGVEDMPPSDPVPPPSPPLRV